jgi:four helix bundle protein
MQARRYQDLIAWQRAVTQVKKVYEVTGSFPQKEVFGLTSQMRRSAVSIPSNIAEGQGRATRGEFHQFLGHARGSLYELETQLVIASELEYISEEQCDCLLDGSRELGRILNALMSSVSKQQLPVRVLTTDN